HESSAHCGTRSARLELVGFGVATSPARVAPRRSLTILLLIEPPLRGMPNSSMPRSYRLFPPTGVHMLLLRNFFSFFILNVWDSGLLLGDRQAQRFEHSADYLAKVYNRKNPGRRILDDTAQCLIG